VRRTWALPAACGPVRAGIAPLRPWAWSGRRRRRPRPLLWGRPRHVVLKSRRAARSRVCAVWTPAQVGIQAVAKAYCSRRAHPTGPCWLLPLVTWPTPSRALTMRELCSRCSGGAPPGLAPVLRPAAGPPVHAAVGSTPRRQARRCCHRRCLLSCLPFLGLAPKALFRARTALALHGRSFRGRRAPPGPPWKAGALVAPGPFRGRGGPPPAWLRRRLLGGGSPPAPTPSPFPPAGACPAPTEKCVDCLLACPHGILGQAGEFAAAGAASWRVAVWLSAAPARASILPFQP